MGGYEILLLPLVLIGLLWFMGAPQRKMRKEQAALMESLAPGTEVMTHGGLYGTVVEVDDEVVVLETSPGVTMRWTKRAIGRVVTPPVDDESTDDEDLDEEYTDESDVDAEYSDEDYDDESVDDEDDEAAEESMDDWEDVEVPDDASSLTEPEDDGDDKPTR